MKVGFIGLGTMGTPMALNLLAAGHHLTVHNRSRDRELPLVEAGAQRAASPAAAAAAAEVVVICVSDTPDVEAVILGPEGVIAGAQPNTLVIDMSTISPTATRTIATQLASQQIAMLDAPVSGGSEGAKNGTLSIMVGGEADAFTRAMPVLQAMGTTITHIGPNGAGQTTKAINQIVVAGTFWAVAEGLALGLKAELDMEKVVQAVGGGAAGSWAFTNRSGNMLDNTYPLGFRMRLHRKDLLIALEAARELGLPLPMAAYVEQIESGLIAQGFGDEDMSAIARSLREMGGI
ncbi:tartronate semialdehyde reductase [Leptolyngbya sp. Heron Island J]|nr:tartronate semialdehyde reductase [Leptolyngbya sp. Heron Island J]